jgi:hypothetical protein
VRFGLRLLAHVRNGFPREPWAFPFLVFFARCDAALPKQPLELQFTNNTLTLRPIISGKILEQDGMFVWTGAAPNGDLVEEIRLERTDSILENIV